MDLNRITYFAETDARNKKIRFGIKSKDRLRHTYVIGKTGVGKSTLLENMAIQDIQNGEGIAFIDPHGNTAEKLLEYVPERRIKDVLYFAPFDMEYPISFNVMEDIGADRRHLVANGLMSTFEKIWVDAWSARMAYILNNTLLALLEYPGATLLGVNRMLADKDYRKKVVDNVKDPSVRSFWVEEFAKYTDKYAAEATPAIQNKVGQFTSNPLVRNLVGQSQSTFDIRDFMDKQKILIINLSKGRVGEGNANLIGSMLITKIYLAAMSRADKTGVELEKLPAFYLYVDEFQTFANKSFADILSESRKYKLSLNITNQYIEQMAEEVRNAVFGNVGTMITFRVGAFDAEIMEKEFAPTFSAEDLVNLGFAQIYLKLMINDVSSQPFSAVTLPPIAKPDINYKEQVINSSRKQFARPRAEVEEDIIKWHGENIQKEIKSRSPEELGVIRNNSRPMAGHMGLQQAKENTDQRKDEHRLETGHKNDLQTPNEQLLYKQNQLPKLNQNKIAFMKAAEILREKEAIQKPVTVSLSSLTRDQDNRKNPTKENISSLKEALSRVINQSSGEKPMQSAQNEKDKSKETIKKPVDEPQPAKTIVPEVPENVLRKLLDMNDSK